MDVNLIMADRIPCPECGAPDIDHGPNGEHLFEAVIRQMAMHNSLIAKMFTMQRAAHWNYQETLERVVIALAENNEQLLASLVKAMRELPPKSIAEYETTAMEALDAADQADESEKTRTADWESGEDV